MHGSPSVSAPFLPSRLPPAPSHLSSSGWDWGSLFSPSRLPLGPMALPLPHLGAGPGAPGAVSPTTATGAQSRKPSTGCQSARLLPPPSGPAGGHTVSPTPPTPPFISTAVPSYLSWLIPAPRAQAWIRGIGPAITSPFPSALVSHPVRVPSSTPCTRLAPWPLPRLWPCCPNWDNSSHLLGASQPHTSPWPSP